MEPNITDLVADVLAALPAGGLERELALQKTAELAAAREALAALQSAAARSADAVRTAPERSSSASLLEADVLSAASRLWQGTEFGWPASNARALQELRRAAASPEFLDVVRGWIVELRAVAGARPNSGACTTASALQLWLWTMTYFRRGAEKRDTAIAELAEALGALIAARCQILALAKPKPFFSASQNLFSDLCHIHAGRAASAVAALCAELVHGYRKHPTWTDEGCSACYGADELDELEGLVPGIASTARAHGDVVEVDGSHPPKAGPCVRLNDLEGFTRLRAKLDGCLTGSRRAQERVAVALAAVTPMAPAGS